MVYTIGNCNEKIYTYGKPGDFTVSDDGKTLASCGSNLIIFWDLSTGKEKQIITTNHQRKINSICFSPDNTKIATASEDKSVGIFDIEKGCEIKKFGGFSESIINVRFSKNGDLLLINDSNNLKRMLNADTGKEVLNLYDYRTAICSEDLGIIILKDNYKRNRYENFIEVFDSHSEKRISLIDCSRYSSGYGNYLNKIHCPPNGQMVAISFNRDLKTCLDFYSIDGNLLFATKSHHKIEKIAFSNDNLYFAVGYSNQTVQIWDASNWKCIRTVPAAPCDKQILFSPDSQILFTSSKNDGCCYWNITTGDKIGSGGPLTIKFLPDSQSIAYFRDESIIISEIKTWKIKHILNGHTGEIDNIYVSANENSIAVSRKENRWHHEFFKFIDLSTGEDITFTIEKKAIFYLNNEQFIVTRENHKKRLNRRYVSKFAKQRIQERGNRVKSYEIAPDRKHFCILSITGSVLIWDIVNTKCICCLSGHEVETAIFSPDSRYIVCKTENLALIHKMEKLDNPVTIALPNNVKQMVCSPDSIHLAISFFTGNVTILNIETGKQIYIDAGIATAISDLSFSHNGFYLAISAYDNKIYLWNSLTEKIERVFKGHTDTIRHLEFSDDEKKLLSGSQDGTARIWDIKESGMEFTNRFASLTPANDRVTCKVMPKSDFGWLFLNFESDKYSHTISISYVYDPFYEMIEFFTNLLSNNLPCAFYFNEEGSFVRLNALVANSHNSFEFIINDELYPESVFFRGVFDKKQFIEEVCTKVKKFIETQEGHGSFFPPTIDEDEMEEEDKTNKTEQVDPNVELRENYLKGFEEILAILHIEKEQE
jgi:WD40 repeat protein